MDDSKSKRSFDEVDIIVFGAMLLISALIGIYQAYKSRKNTDAVREYLVGSQNMSIFPISMSLIARWVRLSRKRIKNHENIRKSLKFQLHIGHYDTGITC